MTQSSVFNSLSYPLLSFGIVTELVDLRRRQSRDNGLIDEKEQRFAFQITKGSKIDLTLEDKMLVYLSAKLYLDY